MQKWQHCSFLHMYSGGGGEMSLPAASGLSPPPRSIRLLLMGKSHSFRVCEFFLDSSLCPCRPLSSAPPPGPPHLSPRSRCSGSSDGLSPPGAPDMLCTLFVRLFLLQADKAGWSNAENVGRAPRAAASEPAVLPVLRDKPWRGAVFRADNVAGHWLISHSKSLPRILEKQDHILPLRDPQQPLPPLNSPTP